MHCGRSQRGISICGWSNCLTSNFHAGFSMGNALSLLADIVAGRNVSDRSLRSYALYSREPKHACYRTNIRAIDAVSEASKQHVYSLRGFIRKQPLLVGAPLMIRVCRITSENAAGSEIYFALVDRMA